MVQPVLKAFRVIACTALLAVTGVLAYPGGALAHHSFAMFDTSKQVDLAGTVTKFEWTNPHTFVWVAVEKEGKVENWAIEGQSPNFLSRRGWTRTTLKPGDKVTVSIAPLRSGETGGMFQKITLADGKVMTMQGESPPPPTPETAPAAR
jgi:hypothetical protein